MRPQAPFWDRMPMATKGGPMGGQGNAELVGAAARGDETAWRALVDRFNGLVRGLRDAPDGFVEYIR